MDEKMKKTLTYVLAGFGGFIFLLFLISSCSKRSYDYEDLVEQMIKVTKNYFEDNKDKLPAQDKDTQTYTLKKMISDGKIEELSKLFKKDDIKCDGNVIVTNNNGNYLYTPYLNCGDDYNTVYLKDKIIENSLVEQGVGLYETNNEYVFKGEINNNYVSINENLYRIVKINEDGTLRLLSMNELKNKKWDDRYNEEYHSNSGINEYELNSINSRIKETITEYYNDEASWPDETKAYIVSQDVCIGKRSEQDPTKDGSAECSKKIADQQLSLLAAYEYMQASLDPGCNSTISKSCKNYNWIASSGIQSWSITTDAESSRYAYVISDTLYLKTCNNQSYLNIVFNLTEKAIYIDGDGTQENPYIFK